MSECSDECATLYVGDLNGKVTEKILKEKFEEFGEILSIKLCRDKTKKSFGYAYVNFKEKAEAQSALDELNHVCICGHPCRIMWYEKDPVKRNSGVGNIVIKDLDELISIKEINDAFGVFGEISSSKLKTDQYGFSTGLAFVNYKYEEDAEKAIEYMNKKIFGKNVIVVENYITKNNIVKDRLKCCYFDNCSHYLDDCLLRKLCEKYGDVVTAKIMVNEDGSSKGFGLVIFKETNDAVNATKSLNGRIIHNSRIHVYRVISTKDVASANLYVNNLSENINEEWLGKEFEVFGKISSIKVMINPETNKSYRYGFVCFQDPNSATMAINEMNGKVIDGKKIFVAYNKSTVKSQQGRMSEPLLNPSLNYLPILNEGFSFVQVPRFISPNLMHFPNISPLNNNPSVTINKKILGDKIYLLINKYVGDKSVNVIQRLLSFDNNKLLHLINNEDLLRIEAQQILEDLNGEAQRNANSIRESPESIECDEQDNLSEEENSFDEILSEEKSNSVCKESSSDEEDSLELKESLVCKLYPLVENISEDMIKDIINQFLSFNNTELLNMLADKDYLKIKIDEAKRVLSLMTDNIVDSNINKVNNSSCGDLKATSEQRDENVTENSLEEKMYNLIIQYAGDLSNEVTDMFLELDNSELLKMINDEDYLKRKIVKARIEIETKNEQNSNIDLEKKCDINNFIFGNLVGINSLDEKPFLQNYTQPINSINTNKDIQFTKLYTDPSFRLINNGQRNSPSNVLFQQTNASKPFYQRPVFVPSNQQAYNITFPFPIHQPSSSNTNQNVRINQRSESLDVKSVLRSKLYLAINKYTNDLNITGRLTAMFLNYNEDVIINMLQNENLLKKKIEETFGGMNSLNPFEFQDQIKAGNCSKEIGALISTDRNNDVNHAQHLRGENKTDAKIYVSDEIISPRNMMIDPMLAQQQQRNSRPITGKVQMNQPRPQYNMLATATGRPVTYPFMGTEAVEGKVNPLVGQIDLNTASKIANADAMKAKQLLGEKIYPLVSKHAGDMAAKITVMFLELDIAELVYMIENEESLRIKIDEAKAVINKHRSKHNRNVTYPYMSTSAGERKSELREDEIDLNVASKIADAMEAKKLLGEKIYPLVSKHAGDMAGKITGMFLELDNAELLYMIENEESLRVKIEEAMAVLSVHRTESEAHPQ